MVGELHEVPEVLDRGVAAAVVEVVHERRAVVGRQHRVRIADHHAPLGVARVLRADARRRSPGRSGGTSPRGKRTRSPSTSRAGRAPRVRATGVVAELDADLLEERVRVLLDEREALLGEDLDRASGRASGTARSRRGPRSGPRCVPRGRHSAGGGSRWSSCLLGAVSVAAVTAVARRRRGRADPPPSSSPIRRSGIATTAASRGNGADRCGMPRAPTNSSWNRGSTAVSILSTVRATRSISARAPADSSAISAPMPAALPTAFTSARSQSGMRPSTIAWSGSIWLPNAPARRTSST